MSLLLQGAGSAGGAGGHVGTTAGDGPVGTLTLAYPTGAAAGDIGILLTSTGEAAPTFPSGYTQRFSAVFGTRTRIHSKVLTSGDIAAGAAIVTATDVLVAQLMVVAGAAEPAAADCAGISGTPASPVPAHADPASTLAVDTVLRFWSSEDGSLAGTIGAGTGTYKTERKRSPGYRTGTYGAPAGSTGLPTFTAPSFSGTYGAVRVPKV